jgi:hypothetical protein
MRGVLIEGRWDESPTPHAEFDDAARLTPDATIHQLAELPALIQQWNQEESLHG